MNKRTDTNPAERLLRETLNVLEPGTEHGLLNMSTIAGRLAWYNKADALRDNIRTHLSSLAAKESAASKKHITPMSVYFPERSPPAPMLEEPNALPLSEEAMWCQSEQTGNWSWRVSKEAYDALRSLLAQQEGMVMVPIRTILDIIFHVQRSTYSAVDWKTDVLNPLHAALEPVREQVKAMLSVAPEQGGEDEDTSGPRQDFEHKIYQDNPPGDKK